MSSTSPSRFKTVNAGETRADHSDIEGEGKTNEKPRGTVPDDIEF